jgi:hypothetical protein
VATWFKINNNFTERIVPAKLQLGSKIENKISRISSIKEKKTSNILKICINNRTFAAFFKKSLV